jgi:hypothetical protein
MMEAGVYNKEKQQVCPMKKRVEEDSLLHQSLTLFDISES